MATKLWIKSPDPSKQCCDCAGKSGPCDSCCSLVIGDTAYDVPFANLTTAQAEMTNSIFSCFLCGNFQGSDVRARQSISISKSSTSLIIVDSLLDPNFFTNSDGEAPTSVSSSFAFDFIVKKGDIITIGVSAFMNQSFVLEPAIMFLNGTGKNQSYQGMGLTNFPLAPYPQLGNPFSFTVVEDGSYAGFFAVACGGTSNASKPMKGDVTWSFSSQKGISMCPIFVKYYDDKGKVKKLPCSYLP